MSGTLSKFVRSFGYFTENMFVAINRQIEMALVGLKDEIDRLPLERTSPKLEEQLETLKAERAKQTGKMPRDIGDDATRYQALEKFLAEVLAAKEAAAQQIDLIPSALDTHRRTAVAAEQAVKNADDAIKQMPNLLPAAAEKKRFIRLQQNLQTRYDAHCRIPDRGFDEITPFTEQLERVRTEAEQLVAQVNKATATLQDRAAKLAKIDLELNNLRKLNKNVVDDAFVKLVGDKLANLMKRRNNLALAELGDQLPIQLGNLLGDISAAAEESKPYVKWGQLKGLRLTIPGACGQYIPEFTKKAKFQLARDSGELLKELQRVETLGASDPVKSLSDFEKIKKEYGRLKEQYYKEILRGTLLAKAAHLESQDQTRDGPEAQMVLALGTAVFNKRLLEAENTSAAFGSPLAGKLSPGEMVAIYTYTSNDYSRMNNGLFGLEPKQGDDMQKTGLMVLQAAKALRKLGNYVGISRRGSAPFPNDDRDFTKDNEFTIPAFWSSGVGFSFPGKWQITIRGKTGKNVSTISQFPSEAEVLFPPGTKFKVIDRDEGDFPTTGEIYVTVEEVV
jgi:hypothetical protein